MIHQDRRREQVIDRDVEKALQLRGMQIDDQRAVRARCGQQISHQLRGNRNPRFVLSILPSVTKIGNHRGNPPSRSPFQRVDHQQQLHQC
jgi:hypothetical protein